MRQFFFILLSFLVCTNSLLAQTTAFTLTTAHTGLDADQNKVLTYVSNLPRNGNLLYVNWDAQGLVGNNGNIYIALPNENNGQPITFELIDAHYATTTEYALFGRSSLGNIALYVTPQGTGGTIDLTTTSYRLYPLGGIKGLLIKGSSTEAESGICGVDSASPEGGGYCEDDCGSALLDVLAMVTPAAQTWVNDNFGIFGQWFLFAETNNINGAFFVSGVPNKRVRVRVINYTPNLPLTTNFALDLVNFRNNAEAQQLGQQNGADIRVLITNQDYTAFGGPFGAIPTDQLDPTTTNKVAIVEVPFIGSIRYTFAHEIAHHFGCRHSVPLGTGCPHGKNMSNGRNTIMANFAQNNTRIQHFSNPDIFFAGEATGNVGTRNNAAQIRGAFCEVVNNNAPTIFSANFGYDPVVCEGYPFYASASAEEGWGLTFLGWEQWCVGPYSYQWSWSGNPNFSNPHNIGTNSSQLELPAPPQCPNFYLRVTITSSAGCSASYTRFIKCQPEPCERDSKGQAGEIASANQITPNPANDQIRVLLDGIGYIKSISAVNSAGTAQQITRFSRSSQGEVTCNVSDLHPGLWFLQVQGSEKSRTLKFAIVR